MEPVQLSFTGRKICNRNKDIRDYVQQIIGMKVISVNQQVFALNVIKHGRGAIRGLGELDKVVERDLKIFISRVEKIVDKDISPSYYNMIITAAKNYFWHYRKKDFPNPKSKYYASLPVLYDKKTFTDVEIVKLLIALESRKLYEQLLLMLFIKGFRLTEALRQHIEHINKEEGFVEITKNSHFTPKYFTKDYERYIYFPDDFFKLVEKYIKTERIKPNFEADDELLFICESNKRETKSTGFPLKQRAIQKLFKVWLELAGIKDLTMHPHQLRSSFVSSQLDSGVAPQNIQVSSGHRHLSSLQPYIRGDRKNRAMKLRKDFTGDAK